VICSPDIFQYELQGDEDFLLVGCDGIWETAEDDGLALIQFVN
jgi:serine/threonine protein phosphatase PrpC